MRCYQVEKLKPMNSILSVLDDETMNDLAVNWYFLTLQANNENDVISDESVNELIETGLKLKHFLILAKFTLQQPMNVYVEGDTYFDIWLDEQGQISVSGLYDEEY